jgi:hypothetical protein
MDSQILVQELQRLHDGEDGAETRALFVISRANLFLLSENDPAQCEGDSLVITARIHTIEEQPVAYFFTSETMLSQWCQQKGIPPFAIQIQGADLSVTLPQGTWIELDPDTPYACKLSPEQLNGLNEVANSEVMGLVVAAPDDDGFVSPIKPEQGVAMPALYKPIDAELKEQAPAGPTKKRFIPKSNPTTLFAAPSMQKKEELTVEKQQSYTSSKLNKVIRSGKSEESE